MDMQLCTVFCVTENQQTDKNYTQTFTNTVIHTNIYRDWTKTRLKKRCY